MKYDEIINLMLNNSNINYSDFYIATLDEDVNFKSKDKKLIQSIKEAKAKGANIHIQNQDGNENSFFHIAVNRRFSEDGIKARLYLSPKHHNLHELAVQFINNSLKAGSDIYFKYARESDRLDRVVVYLKDQEDIYQKINLLSNIKNEYPSLFKDMQKSKVWFNETQIPYVFLEPEPLLENSLGSKSSYGKMFEGALASTKKIMEYIYGIKTNENLSSKKFDPDFYSNFNQIFTEMLKRYGIYMQKNNATNRYEVIAKPVNPNDLRVLFKFEYDKSSQTITEIRGGSLYGEKEERYSFSQQNKGTFLKTVIANKKQFDASSHLR